MSKERATPVDRRLVAMQERIEELERELGTLEDHLRAVEPAFEKQCDAFLADNARLREALYDTLYFLERHSNRWDGVNGKHPNDVAEAAREALATTPEQSLARLRNQVREECIDIVWKYSNEGVEAIECAIRATKGQE